MHTEDFNRILSEQIDICNETLKGKAAEYATGEDRLHNFKKAAHLRSETPKQAIGGMMVKHVVSIFDMIDSSKTHPMEAWNEKITDNINYLILLKAAVHEEQDELVDGFDADHNVAILPADDTPIFTSSQSENGKPVFSSTPLA